MTTTPVSHQALRQGRARHQPYLFHLRVTDALHGRRDAKGQLAYVTGIGGQPTHSLARLKADSDERCEREYHGALTTAAVLIDQARTLDRRIVSGLATIEDLEKRLDVEVAAAAAMPILASANEQHLPHATIVRRRGTDALNLRAPLQAKIQAARSQLAEDHASYAEVLAQIETLWDGLQSRVSAIADYFERRATTQARAYLRRTPPKTGGEHPLITRDPITPPEWADQPNPWLPMTLTREER